MMNVNKLRGKIVEKGYNVERLAKEINLDKSTLYRKMNNEGDTLSIREANMICEKLELTKDEAMSIFFKNYVA